MILVRATWLLLLSAVCGVAAATKSDKVADETSIPNTTALEWVTQTTRGNLNYLLRNLHNKSSGVSSRDLGNGALAALLLDSLTMLHDSNKNVHNGQHTRRYGCDTALLLLQHHGMEFGTSFDAQSLPPIYHGYIDSCFNDTGKAWILEAINRSLPMTKNEATPQEFSYTNMWLMSTVNSILMGEIVGGERGRIAASVGYTMWDQWRDYTAASGVHEFTSPTYTNVQVSALYMGYLYAKRPGATLEFKAALDLIWADTCANYYAGRQALSGPHSRDYDTLLGHGMLLIDMYLFDLPHMTPLSCTYMDPHCEGPTEGTVTGTLEPMTVVALTLFNYVHPRGYRPSPEILSLASLPVREVQHRFLGQHVTANGNEAMFADTYNYIVEGYLLY
eukprot:m.604425 g.604425  ORF g.604425 m.604425 type:complete len:390 (+) comp22459_c0_seq10:130-1299(+)